VLAELNFWQEFWLAVIAAVGVAVGVGGGIVGGFWLAARKATEEFENQRNLAAEQHDRQLALERQRSQADRDNQARLDRDRLLRDERVALYRRLVEVAGLAAGWSDAKPDDTAAGQKAEAALVDWGAVWAEIRLIGSRPVVASAERFNAHLDQRRKERNDAMVRGWVEKLLAKDTSEDQASTPPLPGQKFADDLIASLEVSQRRRAETKERFDELIAACRADLESLGEPGTDAPTADRTPAVPNDSDA
jgi:hypothetical protein